MALLCVVTSPVVGCQWGVSVLDGIRTPYVSEPVFVRSVKPNENNGRRTMKCDKCKQPLPTPIILDALGREVKATDFILWMRPVSRVDFDGLSIATTDGGLGHKPVVLCIHKIEWNSIDKQYCIDASVMYQLVHSPVDIRGEVGVRNMSIYRLARTITELDK